MDADVPVLVTETYPGWFRHWGEANDWAPTDIVNEVATFSQNDTSFILYVITGGTSFGLTSGSNWIGGLFTQDLTSYDYGSPISESGAKSFNYDRYREVMQVAYEEPLIDIPEPIPTMQISNMKFKRVAGIFDQQFITEQETEQPQHFEAYLQNQGLGVYETTLPVGAPGKLIFEHLNDTCCQSLKKEKMRPKSGENTL